MKEIVKKVEKHNKAIAYAFFGKLEEIEICKIKCITDDQALLVFGQNQKVLYINGDVTRESGYQKYLIWFNQNVNQKNRNYIKNILIYDGYGFVEYIEDFSRDERCEDKRFNQKYGELIAIVWSLCGKLITLEHIGVKEGMPVVKNVCSLLDGEIGRSRNTCLAYLAPFSIDQDCTVTALESIHCHCSSILENHYRFNDMWIKGVDIRCRRRHPVEHNQRVVAIGASTATYKERHPVIARLTRSVDHRQP